MKELLGRGPFRQLLIGQTVSALGDWMVTVALMVLALRYSRSSTAVGGVLVLRLLPAAVGGTAAARAVGRWDRRHTMLAMDLARGGAVLAVPLIRGLWWLYIWAFALEVCGLVFIPARDASVPDLVSNKELPAANGLVLASSFATIPLGAAAFALTSALSPSHGWATRLPLLPVFVADAVSFVVSFAMIRRLRMLADRNRQVAEDQAPRLGDAFALSIVRSVMPAVVVISLGLGALFSLGVVFVRDALAATDAEFGVLIVLFGTGAAVGLAALSRARDVDRVAAVRAGTLVQGTTIAVMSLSPSIGPAFLGAAAFGGATAFSLAAGMTVLQDELDGRDRVLAFAAFHTVIRTGLAIAAIAAGVAADLLGDVGSLEPSRVVLVGAGGVVVFGSALVGRRAAVEATG